MAEKTEPRQEQSAQPPREEATVRSVGNIAIGGLETTPVWRKLDAYSDKGYRNKELIETRKQADEELPSFTHIRNRLKAIINHLNNDFNKSLKPSQQEQDATVDRLELGRAFNELGEKAQFYDEKIDKLQNGGELLLAPDSPEAIALLKDVWSAPILDEAAVETPEAQEPLTRDAIAATLKNRLFKDTSAQTSHKDSIVSIVAPQGKTIEIPADIVVDIVGFKSWMGRGTNGSQRMPRADGSVVTSFDLIVDYATRETPPPPAAVLKVYVQPNGKMFAGNGNGDSHRLAADIAMGSEALSARRVEFTTVSENIFE